MDLASILPAIAQYGMLAAAGVATLILLTGDKEKTGGGWKIPKLPSWGSGVASDAPTVGEAYELLSRLDKLSGDRVGAYKAGIDSARKHLTWLKTEDADVAAP